MCSTLDLSIAVVEGDVVRRPWHLVRLSPPSLPLQSVRPSLPPFPLPLSSPPSSVCDLSSPLDLPCAHRPPQHSLPRLASMPPFSSPSPSPFKHHRHSPYPRRSSRLHLKETARAENPWTGLTNSPFRRGGGGKAVMIGRSIYSRSEPCTPPSSFPMQVDVVREEQRLPYVFLSLPLFSLSTDSLPLADLPSSEAAPRHLIALDTSQGWTSTPPSSYANPCQTRCRCSRLPAPAPFQTTFPSLRLSSPYHGAPQTPLTSILARPSPPLT